MSSHVWNHERHLNIPFHTRGGYDHQHSWHKHVSVAMIVIDWVGFWVEEVGLLDSLGDGSNWLLWIMTLIEPLKVMLFRRHRCVWRVDITVGVGVCVCTEIWQYVYFKMVKNYRLREGYVSFSSPTSHSVLLCITFISVVMLCADV